MNLKKNEKFEEEKNVSLAAVARCGESQNSWCEGLDTDSGYQASGINTEEIFSGTRMRIQSIPIESLNKKTNSIVATKYCDNFSS